MSRQPLNIVILGGSFAGLAVAHHFLDHIIHQLSTFDGAPTYRVVLVSPSSHLYWNICAPRALVSPSLIHTEDAFIPIEPAFARHPFNEFAFMQGVATGIDTSAKQVTVELVRGSKAQTIAYHALVIATGSSTYSPLYSLHGTHEETSAEIRNLHRKLEVAGSVLIVGGGPSGVETAGQLATYYKQRRRWPNDVEPDPKKTITLLSGGDRLLPRLAPNIGKRAERKLRGLGVHVVHNLREISNIKNVDGSTSCILNDDIAVTTDVLISATGIYPNTGFLPTNILDQNGYVTTNTQTLRVHGLGVGDRIYAVGDCADYSKNYLLDIYEAIPHLMKNLHNDLLAHEYRLQTLTSIIDPKSLAKMASIPTAKARRKIEALQDSHFEPNPTDLQLMPITRFGGVGVVFNVRVPGFLVYLVKGRNYRMGKAKEAVGRGKDPYPA
ncbi:FAD/NAD(P)-binding domain-containing protein [Corynespora cassiicola Philippines]|uniref:FAD/NAD(P)-binding domain-containing protein n=1 Tax=Corynespora cassiicola Philippines TaxID=1448308 RepID=A0A2T2P9Y4_CORCC|nr:FAD/NAD(P)-binding domain-containing protein [Corynespora cassiicola Philippines]